MASTAVLAGTETLTCPSRACGGIRLCRALAASTATVLDSTICASLSMLTAVLVPLLPSTTFWLAELGVTYTSAVAW